MLRFLLLSDCSASLFNIKAFKVHRVEGNRFKTKFIETTEWNKIYLLTSIAFRLIGSRIIANQPFIVIKWLSLYISRTQNKLIKSLNWIILLLSLLFCRHWPMANKIYSNTRISRKILNSMKWFCEVVYKNVKVSGTVKPVYNGHPRDRKFVAVVYRWSLFRGNVLNWNFKLVVTVLRWSLFRGGC